MKKQGYSEYSYSRVEFTIAVALFNEFSYETKLLSDFPALYYNESYLTEEQIKDIYKQVLRIERPKDEELAKGKGLEKGDASFPCMGLAKDLKKSPRDIADIIKPYLEQLDFVERVESLNGYLNVYYNRAMIFAQMVRG